MRLTTRFDNGEMRRNQVSQALEIIDTVKRDCSRRRDRFPEKIELL